MLNSSLSLPSYLLKPTLAVFCVTNECSLRCKHCSSASTTRLKEELTRREIETMIDDLYEAGLIHLGISGGEPFLRKELFDIVRYAFNKGLDVSISTNGTTITRKIVKDLTNLNQEGSLRLQVSLDGATEETNDKIRGNGVFKKAIQTLKMFLENGLNVSLGFTPNRWNIHEVEQVLNLAIKLRVNTCGFSLFVPTGRGSKNMDLRPKQWAQLLRFLKQKKDELESKDIIRIHFHDARLWWIGYSKPSSIGCSAGFNHCGIAPNGWVYPCIMLPLPVFNVRDRTKTFIEHWRENTFLQKLRSRKYLKGRCASCPNLPRCGGCRAVAYSYTNDPFGPDPRCWVQENSS